jgi:hypothetical protein
MEQRRRKSSSVGLLMLVILIVALPASFLAQIGRRSRRFAALYMEHHRLYTKFDIEHNLRKAEYHRQMREKYLEAKKRPFIVWPDPPEPD